MENLSRRKYRAKARTIGVWCTKKKGQKDILGLTGSPVWSTIKKNVTRSSIFGD